MGKTNDGSGLRIRRLLSDEQVEKYVQTIDSQKFLDGLKDIKPLVSRNSKKVYLPLSDAANWLIGITNSSDGIVLPFVIDGVGGIHLTAYPKKEDDGVFVDIHLTNDRTGSHIEIFRRKISNGEISIFKEKLRGAIRDVCSLVLSKFFVVVDDLQDAALCCVYCTNEDVKLPSKSLQAKEFWENCKLKEKEYLTILPNCRDKSHTVFIHADSGVFLQKSGDSYYYVDTGPEFMEGLDRIISKHFGEESKAVEGIFERAKQTFERECNNVS